MFRSLWAPCPAKSFWKLRRIPKHFLMSVLINAYCLAHVFLHNLQSQVCLHPCNSESFIRVRLQNQQTPKKSKRALCDLEDSRFLTSSRGQGWKKKHHKWFISGIWISRALCRMTSSVSMFARLSPRNQWDHWALQQLDEATCWKIAVHLQKETKPAHLKSLKNHLKALLSVFFLQWKQARQSIQTELSLPFARPSKSRWACCQSTCWGKSFSCMNVPVHDSKNHILRVGQLVHTSHRSSGFCLQESLKSSSDGFA